jgi:hypothetical protein
MAGNNKYTTYDSYDHFGIREHSAATQYHNCASSLYWKPKTSAHPTYYSSPSIQSTSMGGIQTNNY